MLSGFPVPAGYACREDRKAAARRAKREAAIRRFVAAHWVEGKGENGGHM